MPIPFSPENYSSTPSGYTSPEQIAENYKYGQGLLNGGMRDSTITSPWQGVRMMADALAGRTMQNRANQQALQNLNISSQDRSNLNPPFAPQTQPFASNPSPQVAQVGNPTPQLPIAGPSTFALDPTRPFSLGGTTYPSYPNSPPPVV